MRAMKPSFPTGPEAILILLAAAFIALGAAVATAKLFGGGIPFSPQ